MKLVRSADSRTPVVRRRWPVTVVAAAALTAGAIAAASGSPRSRERVIELGPVDLAAAAPHHDMAQPRPVRTVFGEDGMLTEFAFELLDADGNAVPPAVLHHVKVRAPDRRDLFSPLMLRIGAAGSETHPVALPKPVGYAFSAGDSLLVTAMLHNPTGIAWRGVRVRVRLRYEPARSSTRISVMPFFMHVTPPGEPSDYDLPPGRSRRSYTLAPAARVRMLGIGGHAHRYATALRFEDVTSDRVLWNARLTRAPDGEVLRVSRKLFLARGGLPLEPDRMYRVTIEYDNPLPDTLPGAGMGTVAGIVRLAPGARWPAVDRSDPVYRIDAADEH